jgi:hypothetical protein
MSSNNNLHILRKINTQKDLLYYRNDKKKTKIKKKSVFKINSTIQEGRKDIYISDSIKEQISLTYDLILKNRKELNSLKEDKKILNPSQDEESFKYYLNYFYNYLLLFCLLYKIGDMKNARSTLNHLNSEIKHQLKFADFSLFKLQKYNSLVISYIKFLSSYLACLYKLSTDFNFQEILIKYIEIIEAIPENKIILSYLYFFCGRFLVEINYLGLGIKSYELANANANEYASRLQAYKFVVSILYNKSILEYVFYDEKNKNADLCIETLLDAKNTKLKEIEFFSPKNVRTSHRSSISQFRRNSIKIVGETQIKKDKQLLDIYMLLLEFDYKNKNLEAIEDYITFIEANTRYLDKDMIIKAKFILNKINKLHEGRSLLYKSSHRGYNILNQDSKSINEITKSDKYLNNNYINNNNKYQNEIKDEDFINYCLPQRKRPQLNQNEIIEFEKFFIFLTKLSAYQIELLNMDQPDKKNFKKFKSLPIYFSNNFKQSLNLEQMNMLNNIKILMLKRKLVLKNVEHLILVDNLNFDLIYKYEECSVPITQLNNLENINKKKEEFQNFNNELIKASQLRKEKKSAKTELNDENNQYKFKYQNKISYESLKATLKKKYKIENYSHPIDEVIKDSFVIELLNRMKYKEVKMFYDNPEWLLEILINYKKSMENDERSSTKSKEEKEKIDEKIIQHESDNSESSLSDKAEVEQKKSNDILDAMKIGKDE